MNVQTLLLVIVVAVLCQTCLSSSPPDSLTCDQKEDLLNKTCLWTFDKCLLNLKSTTLCRLGEIEGTLGTLENVTSVLEDLESRVKECSCLAEIEAITATVQDLKLQIEVVQDAQRRDKCENETGVYCALDNKCYTSNAFINAQNYDDAVMTCRDVDSNIWTLPADITVLRQCFNLVDGDGLFFYGPDPDPTDNVCPIFKLTNFEFDASTIISNSCTTSNVFFACEIFLLN